MNKRQVKKANKKVVYPLVDETNLVTLSPEEQEQALADLHKWVHQHCRYKHYKDKYKRLRCYSFPIGDAYKEKYKAQMEARLKMARGYN